MKTRIRFVVVLFFVSLTASSQTKYAVEFVGGWLYNGVGVTPSDRFSSGISGGLGVSLFLSPSAELVGNTIFTYYPPIASRSVLVPFVYGVPYSADQSAYSCEIVLGPRFHGHGSSTVHPFLEIQGGIHVMRMVVESGVVPLRTTSGTEFLNIPGTDDVLLRGVLNLGGGVQFAPSPSLLINLQASLKLLMEKESGVNSYIPVMLSVQLPV